MAKAGGVTVLMVALLCTAGAEDTTQLNAKWLWQKIPVTKCCQTDRFYVLGFDSCKFEDFATPSWPPTTVYSRITNLPIAVDAERFNVTHMEHEGVEEAESLECPSGDGGRTTTAFRLYDDGSLLITADGRRLQPGRFCINQIMKDSAIFPGSLDDGQPAFAARFCAPDPCNTTTNCVRKCCPTGMALNSTTRLCQPHTPDLTVIFRNESGAPVEPEPGSVVVRDEMTPKCPFGMYPLVPEEMPEDEFYILTDGRLYVPAYKEEDRYTTDYCTEQFLEAGKASQQALLCFPPQPEETVENKWVLAIFPYFLLLSSLFLIATFIVYAILPDIRNIHGVTIMCHVSSLAVMYIGLAVIQLTKLLPDPICVGLAVVVHFAFLSTFTWLNVMSFDIWWTFSDLRPRGSRHSRQQLGRRFIYYSIYAWGVPFVIVLVGQILDNVKNLPSHIVKPGFGDFKCWFNDKDAFFAYLYGPVAVLICSNIIFFVMTAILLYRASIDAAYAANSAHAKQKFRVIFILFILMGVSWMTEVISFAAGGSALFWIPTDILNILTGVFIFIIFVCKPNVWKLLKIKCPCLESLDACCPSFMKRSSTRQGTTRSTRHESSVSKSLNVGTAGQLDDAKTRRISMTPATQSTQARDSTQVDSGDEMMMAQPSQRDWAE